jgi:AhpD family alkylhydroperoxidase
MTRFPIHTPDGAPEKSRPALRALQNAFGFVPNVAGAIAGSPALADGFVAVFRNVHAGTFTEAQIQVLLLTNAVTNACGWAVAFHTHLALRQGVAPVDVQAIRDGRDPSDPKLAALSGLARQLIERRGDVGDGRVQAFVAAGFGPAQVLETILVVAASTITNYVGNVARPPLETAFAPHAWSGGA